MTAAHFQHRYASAFAMFLDERNEKALRAAYELGRDAVKADLSVLEIARAHHDSLERSLARAPRHDIASICTAAGDFLVESLAAFEMVQRGASDVRRAAFIERRDARILRQLSALLADESLAAGDRESFQEVLQLVAEQMREITGAQSGSVHVIAQTGALMEIDARSDSDGEDTWSDLLKPEDLGGGSSGQLTSIRAPLLALDGSRLGWIEVERQGSSFSPSDEALLTHVAQMTAAAVERALAYVC